MDKDLATYLNKDQAKNMAILGFFSNYRLADYFIEGNSMLLLGRSDHLWAHISSTSERELIALLDQYHKKTSYYFSVEDWMIPVILRYGTVDWMMTTNRYLFDKKINIDLPKPGISRIDKSYAAFLYEQSDY